MTMNGASFKPSTAPASGNNPLQKFRGKLAKWESRTVTYGEGTATARSSMVIDFDFKEITVLRSLEPYPFPITKITIQYANPQTDRGNSRWAVWASSARRVLGRQFELDELVEVWQEWEQLPMKTRLQYANLTEDEKEEEMGKFEARVKDQGLSADALAQGRQAVEAGWYEVERLGWQVVAVDGFGAQATSAEDLFDYLGQQAEGRKEQDYYMALVSDQKVTSKPEIIQAITGKQLVEQLLMLGKITRDPDGTLHSAVAAAAS